MKNKKSLIKRLIQRLAPCLLGALLMPGTAQAVNYYWTNGSGDGVYTNKLNWSPNALPETTDYTADVVIFGTQGGTPTTVTRIAYATPNWATTPNLLHVRFDTAGWTFTSSINIENLNTLNSYGSGTNTVNFSWQQKDNQTWTVGLGNTLYLAKSFYARNKTITLNGGGTLFCSSPFDGYGSGNTYGIKIQNATLKINGNTTSSAVGLVWIDKQEARLQLKTTVAIAKALIGPTNRIRDNVGFGLKVADIGGGYVEISPKILGSLIEVQ